MNSLKLIQHIESLTDISDIMSAMKYLSLMESNKLSRYILHQKRSMQSIELAAKDFLHFYPEFLEEQKTEAHVIVILGSERGFCGNYNDKLLHTLDETVSTTDDIKSNTKIIPIGYKLHNKFENSPACLKKIRGPRLVDEIPEIISELITEISLLASEHQALQLTLLYHSEDYPTPIYHKILPAFQSLEIEKVSYAMPPAINLSKSELFYSLLDEYLFALINQVFYAAFMSENQHRIRHMENALNKLAEKVGNLSLKRNEVRQEEITEELEVIMLSSNTIESLE